jgi:serine/threonine protein kinase
MFSQFSQILNRGHNWGADHWSLGVLIFEMLTGLQAFYKEGMQQMDLFRAIVKGVYDPPRDASDSAVEMVKGFLTRNASDRLGSLAGGEDDILAHRWFGSIDFDLLRSETIKPPFIPNIRNPLDSSNFEDWSHLEDKLKKTYPKLTRDQAAFFDDF